MWVSYPNKQPNKQTKFKKEKVNLALRQQKGGFHCRLVVGNCGLWARAN